MSQLRLFTETEIQKGVRITERDDLVLRWLVEQRAASLPQVGELLARAAGTGPLSERRIRQIVSRWEQAGVAARWSIWHGEPPVVCPTQQAARMHGFGRYRRPGVGIMRHTVTVSGVRLRIERPGADRVWIPETQLRRVCPPGEHLADGGWIEGSGAATAVEVELTPHGRSRVEQAIRSLLAAQVDGRPRWHHVLYLCAPETITQVTAVANMLEPQLRSQVTVRALP